MVNTECGPELNQRHIDNEYEYGVGYLVRWELYRHTDDNLSIHQMAVDALDLTGNVSMLDIGCGRGIFLASIADNGVTGRLVGLDRMRSLDCAETKPNLHYVRADSSVGHQSLPFKDSTFDAASAMFMLYHTADPEQTVHDLTRVVKPAGKIAIATSDIGNKPRHREFESIVADCLGIASPAKYNQHFTYTEADSIMDTVFSSEPKVIDQDTTITITQKDVDEFDTGNYGVLSAYADSMKTMQLPSNAPTEKYYALRRSIDNVVIPLIKSEVASKGTFVERIRRRLYVVTNND